ncbi:GtrA family protein [Pusillimonas sp. TS35]|nr:GtrA family protein [Pusillimonas sp. TS35]
MNSFIKFIISGGLNTTITYVLYIFLLQITTYKVSYTISYTIGICIAYWLNRAFVFNAHRGFVSMLALPFIYVLQYLFGIAVLWFWVDWFGLDEVYGPAIVVFITIPVTYALTRLVFMDKERK